MKIKNIIKSLSCVQDLKITYYKTMLSLVSDEKYVSNRFYKKLGYKVNLASPKTFNEKVTWRILNANTPTFTDLTDKYRVREFVENRIGSQYLVKLLGVYDDAKDIDYSTLPNKFVLKCNHDSGSVVIVNDKKTIDKNFVQDKLNRALKNSFYVITREVHYKGIKPKILCEEFLDDNGKAPSDYKFHMFRKNDDYNMFIQCDLDRFGSHNRAMLTEDWEFAGFSYKKPSPQTLPPKPKNFELMKELALKLSKDFDMVRVDFYDVNGQVFFGELTFTSECGYGEFLPQEWDLKLGEMWDLDKSVADCN